MSEEISSKRISWNGKLETYFAQIGEKSHCLSWIHRKSEEKYSFLTILIDLPVITLGVINGAISVGSTALFKNAEASSVGVGAVALTTAIMTTVGSYFAWAKRAEGHRISAINYDKMYRFLSVEMSLPRNERMSPTDLLKWTTNEYNRLNEISPLVTKSVIDEFKAKFSHEKYAEISKPEITNGLHAIDIYKASEASPDGFKPVNVIVEPAPTLPVPDEPLVRQIATGADA